MKKKILIVDDDPRNIFALKLTLKSKGYDVRSSLSDTKLPDWISSFLQRGQ